MIAVEHLAKLAREGFGLAGVSELAAEEAAVVAREHGRLLAQQLGGGDAVRPVNVSSDSSPTAITMRVGAAASAATSGR